MFQDRRGFFSAIAVAIALLGVLMFAGGTFAQDDNGVPAGEIETSEPTITVDNPDSNLPDWSQTMTPLQFWTVAAGGISTGLTAFALRWIPIPTDPKKAKDVRQVTAFGCAGAVGLIGAYLNGNLNDWQPTISGIVYVAGLAWLMYEKIPGINPVAKTIEGRAAPTLTNT